MSDALARLREMQTADLPVHGGRTLAYVYDSGLPDVDRIGREAVAAYAGSNGLDPTAFPSLLQMENDLVGFTANLLDAPADAVGTVTSGGTESCLLAVQGARDSRPDVERPRMVVPSTVHAAFLKAAHYFGVEAVVVPVGPDFRADAAAMVAAIDEAPGADRAGRRLRAVVRARRRRPGAAGRGRRCRARDPLPRRRLHRRLGAAVRRADRSRRAAVDVRRRRRHLDLGRHPQVRLRPQGHLGPAAPLAGAPAPAVLRARRLAGLHDAQLDHPVDQVRRPARRRVGGRAVAGRRGLRAADPRRLRGRRPDRRRRRRDPRAEPGRRARLDAGRAASPTAPATRSRSATRWPRGTGTSSRRCRTPASRPTSTSRSAPPPSPTSTSSSPR